MRRQLRIRSIDRNPETGAVTIRYGKYGLEFPDRRALVEWAKDQLDDRFLILLGLLTLADGGVTMADIKAIEGKTIVLDTTLPNLVTVT